PLARLHDDVVHVGAERADTRPHDEPGVAGDERSPQAGLVAVEDSECHGLSLSTGVHPEDTALRRSRHRHHRPRTGIAFQRPSGTGPFALWTRHPRLGRGPPGTVVSSRTKGRRMTTSEIHTPLSSEVRDGMRIDWDVPIAMDDGIVLRADLFRPVEDGPVPAL